MPAPSLQLTELSMPLDHSEAELHAALLQRLGLLPEQLLGYTVFRRGVDARKKSAVCFIYTLDVQTHDNAAVWARLQADPARAKHIGPTPDTRYQQVAQAPAGLAERPVVVGTGPCGLFAALTLAQMGFRPLILERGKRVRERTQDTWGFWRKSLLDTESNVQFGEGGAGTFSDGKLWTQVKDPLHRGRQVMLEMVKGGAPEEILWVSKPHVGTFRLVKVVEHLRATIESLGGEFRFGTRLESLHLEAGALRGIGVSGGEQIRTDHLVLAIGHSARDTFAMLHQQGVYVEAKPFSVGFRIEHPQGLIDRARYGPFAGHQLLGAADYKLVHHARNGRAVYSFCMCPGGTVVAASSEVGRVVTNGMSQYSRNERNANAGLVVGITPADFDFDAQGQPLVPPAQRGHALAGVAFQRALESGAYVLGDASYRAPTQRVGDFLAAQPSSAAGAVEPSYKPGVHWTDLAPALPAYAIQALREALPVFGRQIPGFDLADAVLTGVETRTSSPVRIQRHDERHPLAFQSINTRGLYPAGEGAGYAGGIMSAAIDGIKVAEAVALSLLGQAQLVATDRP